MRCDCALVFLILIAPSSTALAASEIVGDVVDVYGNPMPGCVVTNSEGAQSESNDDGEFRIAIEALGEPLRVECPLAEPQTVTDWQTPLVVRVAYEEMQSFDIASELRAPANDTASTTLVSQRDIASVPIRTAEDALRLVPGLVLSQHGSEGKGHQYFMRGFDAIHGADLEVEVAGIPVNEWSNVHAQGYLDLGFVIPETIEEVRVIKGPFSLEQGLFAMAGSARYEVGIPRADRGWRAAYTVGTTNRHRLMGSWADEDSGDFVAVEAIHDDGFGERRRVDRATVAGNLELAGVDVFASAYHADFDLPGTVRGEDFRRGRIDFYDAYDDVSEGASTRALVSLRDRQEFEDGSLEWSGYLSARRLDLFENFTGYLVFEERGDWREQFEESISTGLEVRSVLEVAESLSVRLGAGQRAYVLRQEERETGEFRNDAEPRRDLVASQFASHVLAGLEWSPWSAVAVRGGARADVIYLNASDAVSDTQGSGGDVAISPRASIQWAVVESLDLFAAYGRGLRPPEARAFTGFDPERLGLTEEEAAASAPSITQSDAFEVGTSWQPAPAFGARASVFATFIGREAVFDHVSGLNLELNGTRRLGGELALFSDPLPWLSLLADVTFVDARFVESGNEVPHAPWLVAGGRAVVTHPSGFVSGLRGLVVAPRTLPQGAVSGTHVVLDGSIGYHLEMWRFDLRVENLLASQIREGEYHYASDWRLGQRSELPALHYVAGPPLNARLTVTAVF